MTAVINFRPLLGSSPDEPACFLLTIDECKILLDCGWTERFDTKMLEPLKAVAPDIDVVLISHADMHHMGALPYAIAKLGMKKAKIFGTVPVFNMGTMFLYDVFQSKKSEEDFDMYGIEDVDAVFDANRFQQLKYAQRVPLLLSARAQGIEITSYSSGHSLGGTVWKIAKETEEILYAIEYNNRADRHLNATVLGTAAGPKSPAVLITSAAPPNFTPLPRAQRDEELFKQVVSVLRNNGNVLMPSDSVGRVLEVLMVLDSQWTFHKLPYTLVFLTKQGFSTIELAKTQLEWMSDAARKQFENTRENPFQFRNVKLSYDTNEVMRMRAPMVVVCSMNSLEFGFSRKLFVEWSKNPLNAVIFHERLPRTFASDLLEVAAARKLPACVRMPVKSRVPLQGEELLEFEKKRRAERQKEMEKREEEKRRAEAEAKAEAEDESDDEDLEGGSRQALFSAQSRDLYIPPFELHPMPMFPYKERIVTWDEYGAMIKDEPLLTPAALAVAGGTGLATEMPVPMAAVPAPPPVPEPPMEEDPEASTKCITELQTVEIRCQVSFVDFEGKADFRSVKNITNALNPTRLILVHSSADSKQALRAQLMKAELRERCHLPANGDSLDLTSDTHISSLKLKDSLLANVAFVQEGDYDIAFVSGEVHQPPALVPGTSAVPVLSDLPDNAELPGHAAVFIGDLKLSDLKAALARAGFQTDLQAGVLVCNQSVQIRKDDSVPAEYRHGFVVEGLLCDDYFRVRDLLYQQFKIL